MHTSWKQPIQVVILGMHVHHVRSGKSTHRRSHRKSVPGAGEVNVCLYYCHSPKAKVLNVNHSHPFVGGLNLRTAGRSQTLRMKKDCQKTNAAQEEEKHTPINRCKNRCKVNLRNCSSVHTVSFLVALVLSSRRSKVDKIHSTTDLKRKGKSIGSKGYRHLTALCTAAW